MVFHHRELGNGQGSTRPYPLRPQNEVVHQLVVRLIIRVPYWLSLRSSSTILIVLVLRNRGGCLGKPPPLFHCDTYPILSFMSFSSSSVRSGSSSKSALLAASVAD